MKLAWTKLNFTSDLSNGLFAKLAVISAILLVMCLAAWVRLSTLNTPTVLDYDPWWFYRHAKEILENNMQIPAWDELTYFPPGSPYEPFVGWSYTLAAVYKIVNLFIVTTLTDVAKWSTPILAALTVIPAFILGRRLSNNLGGLTTAIFGILAPALIGVSMAGYCDTDMIVTFYTFLSILSILMAAQKKIGLKAIPYYVFAILVNIAFVFTWGYGWVMLIFFTILVPALVIFRAIEQMIHTKSLKLNVAEIKKESIQLLVPLLVVITLTNILGYLFGLDNMISTFFNGLTFVEGKGLLVNISVAELQQVDIFSRAGFESIVERVGLGPMIFMLLLPLIAAYKIFKKEKIGYTEIFIFMWILVTFFLITRGVRFSLLFSTATVVAAGYSIGNLHNYLKNRGTAIKATFYGFLLVTIVIFISTAITVGYSGEGMAISSNWYNMLDWLKANANPKSLVVTWWDPGHIITGYTGLRAMADGAHCGIGKCIPYNHNFRIQDMGATFSTSNENDSIQILSAYRQLTPEQCAEDRSIFGDKVPADACDQIPEMYVIASSDLVGKYYWLSYFGSCITKYGVGNSSYCHVLAPDQFEKIAQGRNFLQLSITNYDPNNGVITYGDGQLSLAYKDGKWVPVLNFPTQGIRNVVVKDVVYFENGQQKSVTFNDTQAIDGMVWVDPSYRVVIFMDATIRDSIFTRMFFFNGEGLQHFKLVFQNSEIKMFKVVW